VRANFEDIYLQGMRDTSIRSATELAREIQPTDWSTAGEQGKLVFVVSTKPSLAQFISLLTTGKNRRSSKSHTNSSFSLSDFSQDKNVENKFVLRNKIGPIRRLRVASKLV